MCNEDNVEGTSNTEGNVIAGNDIQTSYLPQFEYENHHVYGHTSFDNVEVLSNYTYGVLFYNTSYVPET